MSKAERAEKYTPDWSRTRNAYDDDPNVSERYKAKLRKDRERFMHNIHTDPCHEEKQMTLRCLRISAEAADCENYSQNALNCQTFWKSIIKDRKRKKIEPNVPPVEERPQILQEYADRINR